MTAQFPLSLLDLCAVGPSETIAQSFAGSVALAQLAERLGYRRIWYAEHHSIPSIASAATSVLISHVAAHTKTIVLGSGGIMLPNHSPLTIAEQFGTWLSCTPVGSIWDWVVHLVVTPPRFMHSDARLTRQSGSLRTCLSCAACSVMRVPLPAYAPFLGMAPTYLSISLGRLCLAL